MRPVLFSLCVLAAACATAPTTPAAAPVIAAERAFAARAAEVGWVRAFRDFVAPDGIILRAAPVGAPEAFAAIPDTGDKSLEWWPAYAGISRSGDLGFTTGPALTGDGPDVRVHYFTLWRRQPDGSWKWVFDGGVGVVDPAPIARAALDIPTLPVANGGAGSAAAAIAQVTALERTHATAVSIQALLADTVRINRAGLPPGIGADSAATLFTSPAVDVTYAPVRSEASSAGDLVMTINDARWMADGGERRGHAVRLWQWQAGQWRIVFDELIPGRTPG